jgi:putative hemolysin
MEPLVRGALEARLARAGEVEAALALRAQVFRGGRADRDAMDTACAHVLVLQGSTLTATFRIRPYASDQIAGSYSGRRYDLSRLAARGGVMVEMGRFCTDQQQGPDAIRLAWAFAARLVDGWGAGFLFGCTSFQGTDPAEEGAALGLLATRNLAPPEWAPGKRSSEIYAIAGLPMPEDATAALARLPPLLRAYLTLGGRVSDHAVIDRDLGTFHVFTGLDIAAIPPARAAALRDLSR